MACNVDRQWSENRILGMPIATILRGYSLQMDVMRKILLHVKRAMHERNIHSPVTVFDGQYMAFLQRDDKGIPLTELGLRKDLYLSTKKKNKASLLQEILDVQIDSASGVIIGQQGVAVSSTALLRHVLSAHTPANDDEMPLDMIE